MAACSHKHNIDDVGHLKTAVLAQNISDQDYAAAIIEAGIKNGWLCKKICPGKVACSLDARKHSVYIEVVYDTNSFSINYVNSINMGEQGKIHSKYKKWVDNLKYAIIKELNGITYKS